MALDCPLLKLAELAKCVKGPSRTARPVRCPFPERLRTRLRDGTMKMYLKEAQCPESPALTAAK